MNVAVVGAGAVGCYYGFLLAKAGYAVTLIGRPALVEAVRSDGLVLESAAGAGSVPVQATTEGNGVAGANLVLVCTAPSFRFLADARRHVEQYGTPEQIRAFIRKQKEAGADVIKIFAAASIRQGGNMTLSQEQLNAACEEARKQGLRAVVHAYTTLYDEVTGQRLKDSIDLIEQQRQAFEGSVSSNRQLIQYGSQPDWQPVP